MGISVFPSGGGGEFITNDFVVDMNNTENNVIDLGRSYSAGSYDVSLASGDSTFDIYAIDADGNSIGYTNNATLIATDPFTVLVILGVAIDEKITFSFAGASNNATSEGDAPGAGAYLESINPSDLPNIDDTANVIGGNFATDVEFFFESGTVSTPAKNIVRSDATALVVTRPDNLDPALDPWDVRVNNPGVTPPSSVPFVLSGTVDAGATPVWVTTSPLDPAFPNQAYSATLVATDADGSVSYSITSGSFPGLTLNGATGVISGTATATGTATVEVADEGGNTNSRVFEIPFQKVSGGSVSTFDGMTYHTLTSTDDLEFFGESVEYLIVGAGGGGGDAPSSFTDGDSGGGGGAGEVQFGTATPTGVLTCTVGATTPPHTNGASSSIPTVGTAIGGGAGGSWTGTGLDGKNGGSGGGGANTGDAGLATGTGLGFDGRAGSPFQNFSTNTAAGGGGGSGGVAPELTNFTSGPGNGGIGASFPDFVSATGRGENGKLAAGGAGGAPGQNFPLPVGGEGGGGDGAYGLNSDGMTSGNAGAFATGSGGGGGRTQGNNTPRPGSNGGSGLIVVRYS